MKPLSLLKRFNWLFACLGLASPIVVWSSNEMVNNMVGLLENVRAAPSAPQQEQAQDQLIGVWVSFDGKYPDLLAISKEGSVFNAGRLGGYELSSYRAPYSTTELDELLTSLLAEADSARQNSNPETIEEGIRAVVEKGLKKRATNLLAIARESKARGEQTIPKVHLKIRYAQKSRGDKEEGFIALFYTETRIYLWKGNSYSSYVRYDALSKADRERVFGRLSLNDPRGAFLRRIENAYLDVRRYCYQLLLGDEPVDECRAQRDRAAEFGLPLRPEDVHPRDMSIPLPTAAHHAFWKEPTAVDAPGGQYLPRLDYCFDPTAAGVGYEAFFGQLAARGFRNTLWAFQVNRWLPGAKPGNWTEQEYKNIKPYFGDQNSFPSGAKILLRADGIIGFSFFGGPIAYDSRNRWSLRDKMLYLGFHNDAVWLRFSVKNTGLVDGKTNLPLAKGMHLILKPGDYQLYDHTYEVIGMHPDAAELDALMRNPSCPNGTHVADVSVQQTPETPTTQTSVFDVPIEGMSADFPRTWFARTELANGKKDPNPENQAAMDKGVYYRLAAPNLLGTSESPSGPFETVKGASWVLDGNRLVWTFAASANERFTFALSPDFQGEAGSVGIVNKQYRMVVSPAGVSGSGQSEGTSKQSSTAVNESVSASPVKPEPPPEWEVIGYWNYDAVDGQELKHGLVLRKKNGSRNGITWGYQLDMVNHTKLPKRNRQLWPVQINRTKKQVCVNAPYPTYPGHIDLPGDEYDGVYTFASCKGGK